MNMDEMSRRDVVARGYGELIGKTIKNVRPLMREECEMFAWDYDTELAWMIEFTDGTCAIPSADHEGNGSGHLFIEDLEPLDS
jgi:hypothetical protein